MGWRRIVSSKGTPCVCGFINNVALGKPWWRAHNHKINPCDLCVVYSIDISCVFRVCIWSTLSTISRCNHCFENVNILLGMEGWYIIWFKFSIHIPVCFHLCYEAGSLHCDMRRLRDLTAWSSIVSFIYSPPLGPC